MMNEWKVPHLPENWLQDDLASLDWSALPALPAFILAETSQEAVQQTRVRLGQVGDWLWLRFDCRDRDIWGAFTRRDDPIYDEEVVEGFLAPGEADPLEYFEFEVSPFGVLFDARIHNPNGLHDDKMSGDAAWNCPGIRWQAGIDAARQNWWAVLGIPLQELCGCSPLPTVWRANFYRIERPHGEEAEYSCWSPVDTPVADFHRPARFGQLLLEK